MPPPGEGGVGAVGVHPHQGEAGQDQADGGERGGRRADVDVLRSRLQEDHRDRSEAQRSDGSVASAGADQPGQQEHRCRSQADQDGLDEDGVLHGAKEHSRERFEKLLALGIDVGVQVLRRLDQSARHHPHVRRDEVVGVGVVAVGRQPNTEVENPSVGHQRRAPKTNTRGWRGVGQSAPQSCGEGPGAPPHECSPPPERPTHLDRADHQRGPPQPARGEVVEGPCHQGHHRGLGDEDHQPRGDHHRGHPQAEGQDPHAAANGECEQCQEEEGHGALGVAAGACSPPNAEDAPAASGGRSTLTAP